MLILTLTLILHLHLIFTYWGDIMMTKRLMILFIGLFWSFTSLFVYADSFEMHTVEPNDTYWKIAEEHNKNIDEIKTINSTEHNALQEGSLIKIQSLPKTISIQVNGKEVHPDSDPYIENSRTFVPIRFVAEALGIEEISWDEEAETAVLGNNDITISLPYGSHIARVNSTGMKLEAPINIWDDRIFVPVRFIAETFDCTVQWDAKNYIINIKSNASIADTSYTQEDLYWLSRIVESEAPQEPYEGKLAVANVVINRKDSSGFPNVIKDVIFDTSGGFYQFSPVLHGTIYNDPSEESIQAAKEALEGNNNIGESLFFLNPRKATTFWITTARTFYKTIHHHDFYL